MNNRLQLYYVNEEIQDVLDKAVDPETGEILDIEAFDRVTALELKEEEIIHSIANVILHSDVNEDAINNEIKRLTEMKRKEVSKKDNAKKFLKKWLKEGQKYNFENCKISWRKSTKVVVDDLVSPEGLKITYPELVKTKYEVDKTAIKQMYKDNKTLPSGIRIVEENNIQIK